MGLWNDLDGRLIWIITYSMGAGKMSWHRFISLGIPAMLGQYGPILAPDTKSDVERRLRLYNLSYFGELALGSMEIFHGSGGKVKLVVEGPIAEVGCWIFGWYNLLWEG